MLFKSTPAPAPKPSPEFQPIVAYLKASNGKDFDRDLKLLESALQQFKTPYSLVIEQEGSCEKMDKLFLETRMARVKTLIVPDFSHLGADRSHWSSVLGDLFVFSSIDLKLVSVRDGYDSKKDDVRSAISIICQKIKNQNAA